MKKSNKPPIAKKPNLEGRKTKIKFQSHMTSKSLPESSVEYLKVKVGKEVKTGTAANDVPPRPPSGVEVSHGEVVEYSRTTKLDDQLFSYHLPIQSADNESKFSQVFQKEQGVIDQREKYIKVSV